MQAGGQEFESPHIHQFPYLDIASNLLDGSYRDKSGKQSGKQLIEAFIKDSNSTKGLTPPLIYVTPFFLQCSAQLGTALPSPGARRCTPQLLGV